MADPDILPAIESALTSLADPARALILARFFKTAPGEYGHGDHFRGIPVPALRQLTRRFGAASGLPVVRRLLASRWHEDRLLALLLLVRYFERGDETARGRAYAFYLAHTRRINNWDLVDLSAPNIVGAWLLDRDPAELRRLVVSPRLWERRIAILASFAFIRAGRFELTTELAERLLDDPEDLLHKATGWMLREVGKRDLATLRAFLDRHAARLPRTALRYAIEKMSPPERQRWMNRRALAMR